MANVQLSSIPQLLTFASRNLTIHITIVRNNIHSGFCQELLLWKTDFREYVLIVTIMSTLYKAEEMLEVDSFGLRGTVYWEDNLNS